MLSNLEIIGFKKFLALPNWTRPIWPRPILAVLRIFFIQLFPNWTACSLITYTNLLKTGSLDNTIQDFLLAWPLWYMSQYTIISKCGKHTRQLKFNKKGKKFSLQKQWLRQSKVF